MKQNDASGNGSIWAAVLPVRTLPLRAIDALILLTLLFFNVLTVVYRLRLPRWPRLLARNTVVAVVYIFLLYLLQRTHRRFWHFLLRTASVQLLFAYLYDTVQPLQLLFTSAWHDPQVLALEERFFSVQPTVWLQRFVSPGLTEWLMFSYVIYVVIYPLLCGLIYFKRGAGQMEDYLFSLGLANVFCDLGFLLFPVAGPLHAIADRFGVPLHGYLFTTLGEYIRSHVHAIGRTIPSPHCAAATVMWIMAWRYHRPTFFVLTPVIVSLYVSTVYGRYHYVSDALAGIAIAFLAVVLAPLLARGWRRLVTRA